MASGCVSLFGRSGVALLLLELALNGIVKFDTYGQESKVFVEEFVRYSSTSYQYSLYKRLSYKLLCV